MKYRGLTTSILGLTFLGFLCLPSGVLAATAQTKKNNGLRVVPLRSYPSQQPGTTSTGSLTVTNQTEKSLNVILSVEDFKVVNEEYDYSFSESKEVGWIQFTDTGINLASQETKSIPYGLAVPNDASPGGHYFALVASANTPRDTIDITEIRRVASLVYLEVSGKLVKKGGLRNIDAPWFTTTGNIEIAASLVNNGNTHTRARLSFRQRFIPFGRTAVTDQSEALVLPATVRTLHQTSQLPKLPGVYSISAEYAPPQGGLVIKSRKVLYVPWWSLAMVPIIAYWLRWEWKRYQKINHREKQPAAKPN